LNGKNYSQEAVVLATAAAGGGLGTLLGVSGGGVGGAVIGGVGAATVAMNTKASTFSRSQKRLKTAIALHVPNQLAIRYGAGWSEEETFAMQALIDGGEAGARALADAGKALVDKKGDQAAAAIIGGAKNLSPIAASVAMSKGPMGGALSALSGLAPNPMKEQIFKGMDFRSFTMEYQFAPRNETESNNVNNIIRTFKYHMHPEFKDDNNFVYLYPSEFDIFYYQGGEENLNLHRHTSCVLTELNVNYTPNGNFTTFDNGMPTQINIQLSFRELALLTKDKVMDGL
jgi:hypothetical protein